MANGQTQYNVNLKFTADTSSAKNQLNSLQQQLQSLYGSTNKELGINKELTNAQQQVAQLSVHLKNATNVNTGALDFTKLILLFSKVAIPTES